VTLGAYVGWKNSAGLTASQLAAAAKAINPNFRMFVYTDIMEDTNPPSIVAENNSQIASVPWWALTGWPGGSPVSTGGGRYAVNITTHTNLLNGQNYPQWRASKDFASFLSGNPSVDGLYIDNAIVRFQDNPRRLGKNRVRLVDPVPLKPSREGRRRQNSPVPLARSRVPYANEGLGGEGQ
jgi:hypothetical protein